MDMNGLVVQTFLLQLTFIVTSAGSGQLKDFGNGCSLCPLIGSLQPIDHICYQATLTIGRPGQRNVGRPACHSIDDFDDIPNRENIRLTGPHLRIHLDSTLEAQF